MIYKDSKILDEHNLAGSPGPRGLVLAHPFEGKYYDYRDPRVSSNLTI